MPERDTLIFLGCSIAALAGALSGGPLGPWLVGPFMLPCTLEYDLPKDPSGKAREGGGGAPGAGAKPDPPHGNVQSGPGGGHLQPIGTGLSK
jgi:hypothetical protein